MPQLNRDGRAGDVYCQPANDFLPDPESCLITGITPQECLEKACPNTSLRPASKRRWPGPAPSGVGYNTIRFDDEITRFMFWRNLIDPYAREWQNDCGRWDLLDVVRTAYALRPDGIQWPRKAEGKPSFKLTDLTAANGLVHEAAHDALSDVRATIALARLIRTAQPQAVRLLPGPAQEGPRLPRSLGCRPRHRRRGRSACLGHVPRRARLPGDDVAAGHAPHQQERTAGLGPGACAGRTGALNADADPPALFTRSPNCPRASSGCRSSRCISTSRRW
jgi:hypothetical protein